MQHFDFILNYERYLELTAILYVFWGQKWKKQYFILSISQASTTLPGQCPAILDYYSSEKQSHKRGSIDLNSCDEVEANVASPPYEHVFTLRTKHKDHDRTYFLAAETEDDMNRWMQCLCSVLQLNDGCEYWN